MKSIILILSGILFYTNTSLCQQVIDDIGIQGGVAYYLGDVNQDKQFYSVEPAFGIELRKNINPRYSVRFQFIQANIKGNDLDFNNGYQQQRAHHFYNILYETGFLGEINFLEYNPWNRQNFTTYVTSGIEITIATKDENITTLTIPMGLGIKYAYKKRFTISPEWAMRKTFTDNLDLLHQNQILDSAPLKSNKQTTNVNTKDWYSVACIVITYNFSGSTKWCPAYGKKRNKKFYEL